MNKLEEIVQALEADDVEIIIRKRSNRIVVDQPVVSNLLQEQIMDFLRKVSTSGAKPKEKKFGNTSADCQ